MVSLATAVGCVAFSASILGGFSQQMERLAFGDYARTLVVRLNPLVTSRAGPPSLDDLSLLSRELTGVETSAAWAQSAVAVRVGADTRTVPVFGALGDYRRELDADLVAGRWIDEREAAGLARVCLVGANLAAFLGEEDLIGREVSLGGPRCEVVGILDYARSRPSARFNDAAIAPFLVTRRYFATAGLTEAQQPGGRDADWLSLFMAPRSNMREARYQADRLLRRSAGVPLSRESPYSYDDPGALIAEQAAQKSVLEKLLWTITGAALLTSLIGYGGIAFAATAARRREVALRMAMGATPANILAQILLEHLIVAMTASVAGLGLGVATAIAASQIWDWPVVLNWTAGVGSIGLGCLLGGTLGGLAARSAARTPPALAAKA